MATTLPRVIGLEDLLALRKPLREKPAPLVYFSDEEFEGLLRDATELTRRPPKALPLAGFDPWPGGGVVQSRCESPPGQTCFGQWSPGPAGGGVYFDCRCRPTDGGIPPVDPRTSCRLSINPGSFFECVGECRFGSCGLSFVRDDAGRWAIGCRCRR